MTMSVAEAFRTMFGAAAPVRFTAYDGSATGPDDAPYHVDLRSERGLNYLITSPGSVGMARAYLMGDLVVDPIDEADPYDVLKFFEDSLVPTRPGLARNARAAGLPARAPAEAPAAARRRRRRATCTASPTTHPRRRRDADAIHHHYDVSNRFYELLLGESMAYTCACTRRRSRRWRRRSTRSSTSSAASSGSSPACGCSTSAAAGRHGPPRRHALRRHRGRRDAVPGQAEWAQARIDAEGLSGRATVVQSDYRDITETGFDRRLLDRPHRAHRVRTTRRTSASCATASSRAAGSSTTASRGRTTPSRDPQGRLHQQVRLPRRRLTGSGDIVRCMEDNGLEVRHRRTCASTTRSPPAPGPQPVQALGGVRRGGGRRTARVWGLLPRRLLALLRAQPDPAAPGPREQDHAGRDERLLAAPHLGQLTRDAVRRPAPSPEGRGAVRASDGAQLGDGGGPLAQPVRDLGRRIGRAMCQPWTPSQPRDCRTASSSAVSTPSAIERMPSARARSTRAWTMPTPRSPRDIAEMKPRSILISSTWSELSRSSDE